MTDRREGSVAGVISLIIIVLLVSGLGIWMAVSRVNTLNAEIRGMTVAGHNLGGSLVLEFRKLPAGTTNACDIRIVFSGICLEKEAVYDWNAIVENSSDINTPSEHPKGIVKDQPPPLKSPFQFNYSLPPVTQIPKIRMSDDILLTADLYWGGKLQDSKQQPTRHLFQRN
jgi:hypothetical protein